LVEGLKVYPSTTMKGFISFQSKFSDNPVFLQETARRAEGLRKAGLPEE